MAGYAAVALSLITLVVVAATPDYGDYIILDDYDGPSPRAIQCSVYYQNSECIDCDVALRLRCPRGSCDCLLDYSTQECYKGGCIFKCCKPRNKCCYEQGQLCDYCFRPRLQDVFFLGK